MFAPALLAFSLPLLPYALNIVSPVVNQVWDVALDQIIFWDYNSSDPANLSLVLENPGWGMTIYLAPNFASDYEYYYKTDNQNASLSAIWFANNSLPLHYYNDIWSLSAKSANWSEDVISSLGPITLVDSQNPAEANATHPPAAQQHFGALDVPEGPTGPPWFLLFGIAAASCILLILCGEGISLMLKYRMRKSTENAKTSGNHTLWVKQPAYQLKYAEAT